MSRPSPSPRRRERDPLFLSRAYHQRRLHIRAPCSCRCSWIVGTLNTIIPYTFICGVHIFAWIAMHGTGALMAFALLYGFFSGSFISPPPSTLVASIRISARIGMSFGFSGIGALVGSPVEGALLNLQTGHYLLLRCRHAHCLRNARHSTRGNFWRRDRGEDLGISGRSTMPVLSRAHSGMAGTMSFLN